MRELRTSGRICGGSGCDGAYPGGHERRWLSGPRIRSYPTEPSGLAASEV
jgi:hypothetical protein